MARPKELVDMQLTERAGAELAKLHDHEVCTRLQAILSCQDHAMNTVASVMGITPSTLRRWARLFRSHGVEGLRDKPKGHRSPKLTSAQQAEVKRWLEQAENAQEEPVHWTLEKLAAEIHTVFGVSLTTTPLWRWLRLWGFRQKVPRPHHRKADPNQQEAFKKNR